MPGAWHSRPLRNKIHSPSPPDPSLCSLSPRHPSMGHSAFDVQFSWSAEPLVLGALLRAGFPGPRLQPRISTEFTGKCMKVIRSPLGLAFVKCSPRGWEAGGLRALRASLWPSGKQGSGPTGLQDSRLPRLALASYVWPPLPPRCWLWESTLGTDSAQLLGVGPSHPGVEFPGAQQAAPILLLKAFYSAVL